MNKEIFDYIETQKVGVLSVEMLDSSPHGATVHFAHTDAPVFYFETARDSKKAEAILGRENTRASFVIGANELNPITLQMNGIVRLLKEDEEEAFNAVYLGKFPNKKSKTGPGYIKFVFTPTWWRFTDYTRPEGKFILSSE